MSALLEYQPEIHRACLWLARERSPGYQTGTDDRASSLARELLDAATSLRQAENRVARQEAALVAALRRDRSFRSLGYSSFADLAREELQMTPGTARNRVTLHEAFTAWPDLETAFVTGDISACQVVTIAPAVTAESLPFWIELARTSPVLELAHRVRAIRRDDASIDPAGEWITFRAPAIVAQAWEEALDVASRVLGRGAARYECVEAILAEAAPEAALCDAPEETELDDMPSEPGGGAVSRNPRRKTPRCRSLRHEERARDTLVLAHHWIGRIEALVDSPPVSPLEIVARHRELRRVERHLRLVSSRLLRDLLDTGVVESLGYERLGDFVRDHLKLSERAVHDRVSEILLFESEPEIERAWTAGRISLTHARQIQRLTSPEFRVEFIHRAESVTVRQFEREMRFAERLSSIGPCLKERFPGPLPAPGLADAMEEGPADAGTTGHNPEARAANICASPVQDPAEDLAVMECLESLLGDLILRRAEQEMSWRADVTIRFWAPRSVAAHWIAALREHGDSLPEWARVTLLLKTAVDTWVHGTPRHRICERDEYRCQVPGCTSRRNLEIHHIVFRSRGGRNDESNLVTLCHAHHRRGLHEGKLTVERTSDGQLLWIVAGRRYLGDRKLLLT